jgi:hypothetical protein
MAGFVAIGDNRYIGTLKLATGQADIENGSFVVPNWTAGTCATPTDNTGDAYFVVNEIDTVEGQVTNDLEYKISAGDYVKMKKLQVGEIFVTTKTAAAHSVGVVVDVGTGSLAASSGSPSQTFTVIEKPTLWGVTAYKCVVND